MSAPLYDHEIERRLLGGLLDGGDVNAANDLMQAADLYHRQHQSIFAAAAEVYRKGGAVSPATVFAELRRMGHSDIPITELEALQREGIVAFAAEQIASYAETVRNFARRRDLVRTLMDAARLAQNADLPVTELLEKAQQQVMGLVARSEAVEVADAAEVVRDGWECIETLANSKDGLLGVSTGFADLDRVTGGLQGGNTYIVAGRTSMGKTWLALNLATNVALKAERPVLFFSLEMARRQIGKRLLCMHAGVSTKEITQGLTPAQKTNLQKAAETLSRGQFYLDDSGSASLAHISARARSKHMHAPLGLIVVDYVQYVKTGRDDGENRTLQIGAVSRGLKALAKELDVPVLLLAQVSRRVEERANKRPTLSDLRESGDLENDADAVMFVYRDEYYDAMSSDKGVAEIILAKQRDGQVGTVTLRYDEASGRFNDLAREPAGMLR